MPLAERSHVADEYTTLQVARRLGISVRSVQLMVDRGELEAWKTSGGHRRIARASVDAWRDSRRAGAPSRPAALDPPAATTPRRPPAGSAPARGVRPGETTQRPCALLIEDSSYFQKLIANLFSQRFPGVVLHVADDAIAGLALFGRLEPDVLIVDILLPGIDGAALITGLRAHSWLSSRSRLVVVTSLDEAQRAPYASALEGTPVIHKPRLAAELPALLAPWLDDGAALASAP